MLSYFVFDDITLITSIPHWWHVWVIDLLLIRLFFTHFMTVCCESVASIVCCSFIIHMMILSLSKYIPSWWHVWSELTWSELYVCRGVFYSKRIPSWWHAWKSSQAKPSEKWVLCVCCGVFLSEFFRLRMPSPRKATPGRIALRRKGCSKKRFCPCG